MQTCKTLTLYMLITTYFLIFVGCHKLDTLSMRQQQSIGDHFSVGKDEVVLNKKEEEINLVNEGAIGLGVISVDRGMSLDDFLSNPSFNSQENQEIKKAIVDVLLYIFGFEVDYNNIQLATDEYESVAWFLEDSYHKDGWTISDEIRSLREEKKTFTIASIETNFMMRCYFAEANSFHISVPFYPIYDDDGVVIVVGGYFLYDFYFKKIGNKFKLVGLTMGR